MIARGMKAVPRSWRNCTTLGRGDKVDVREDCICDSDIQAVAQELARLWDRQPWAEMSEITRSYYESRAWRVLTPIFAVSRATA